MSVYDSDTEQLETLKRWWRNNGRSILAGLALGLAGVLGWNYWRSSTIAHSEEASQRYDHLVALLEAKNYVEAERHGSELIGDFPQSGYAGLASLLLAKAAFQAKDIQLAKSHLRWAMEHAEGLEVPSIARLRLVRLLLNEKAYSEAIALLGTTAPASFVAPYEEVRADILTAQGDSNEARSAYQKALAALPPFGANRDRVQMKMDDLGTPRYSQAGASKNKQADMPVKEPPAQ